MEYQDYVQVPEGLWVKIHGVVYMCQRTEHKEIPVFAIQEPKFFAGGEEVSDGRCAESWHGVPCRNGCNDIKELKHDHRDPCLKALEAERDRLKVKLEKWRNGLQDCLEENNQEISRLRSEIRTLSEHRSTILLENNQLKAEVVANNIIISQTRSDRDAWKAELENLNKATLGEV